LQCHQRALILKELQSNIAQSGGSLMARGSDTARARSVKAVFNDAFSATVHGGAVLIEKVIRGVGLGD
jgi:hypothetical protein